MLGERKKGNYTADQISTTYFNVPATLNTNNGNYQVIYSKFNKNKLIGLARCLSEMHGIDPCYWIGLDKWRNEVFQHFPGIPFHSQEHAIRGLTPNEFSNIALEPITPELVHQLWYYISVAMKMMDRFEYYKSISCDERLEYCYYHIKYWSSILEKFKPDAFICNQSPHNAFDFLLYGLCKRKGISTIVQRKTHIPGVIVPALGIEIELKNEISREERSGKLSEAMEKYYRQMRSDYSSAAPKYMKGVFKEEKASKVKNIAHFLLQNATNIQTNFYYECHLKSKILMLSLFNIYKCKSWLKKLRLKAYYEKLCRSSEIDLKMPFILVGLHLQPERTTVPEGDIFGNQLIMVEMLSKAAPKGWNVYVRENPKQNRFHVNEPGGLARSLRFYERLNAFENVKLISCDVEPYRFLDNAEVVATVTGTIGWEAVLRGRPALVFGYAWYKDCEGVYYTPSQKECEKAIKKIADGYRVNEDKVREFINFMEYRYSTGANNLWGQDQHSQRLGEIIEQLLRTAGQKQTTYDSL